MLDLQETRATVSFDLWDSDDLNIIVDNLRAVYEKQEIVYEFIWSYQRHETDDQYKPYWRCQD